jgi:site-specific recombinase XerD
MDGKKSREAALEFLEYVAQKGLMAQATARARKAAVSKVLGILDENEARDVTSIDLHAVMSRFGHLQGKGYTPQSLVNYKSRVKTALDDFASYVENPLAFKPSVQARERKAISGKTSSSVTKNTSEGLTSEARRQSASTVAGPMASSILPIPIRADLTVHIQGLPFDLTEAEAKKIAGVIQAMATPA